MWPYQRLPMERYFHSTTWAIASARIIRRIGCPFACNFCAVVGMANRALGAAVAGRVWRACSSSFSTHYGADAVQFHDMDFFISEPRTLAIAERLAPTGHDVVGARPRGRADALPRRPPGQAMKRSGLKMVFCGAESGSTDMLKRMNKGGTAAAELTLELARRMKAHGIVPEFSFVVGNPPDPEGRSAQTLAFIRRIKTINPATEIILYVYSPVPARRQRSTKPRDPARHEAFEFPAYARRLGQRSLAGVRAAARSAAHRGRTATCASACATSRAC